MARTHAGMTSVGYRALEAKNSGMVMAWPQQPEHLSLGHLEAEVVHRPHRPELADEAVGRHRRRAQRIAPVPEKRRTGRGCRSDSTASTSAANPNSSSPKLTVWPQLPADAPVLPVGRDGTGRGVAR